jgi:hypothetical protein
MTGGDSGCTATDCGGSDNFAQLSGHKRCCTAFRNSYSASDYQLHLPVRMRHIATTVLFLLSAAPALAADPTVTIAIRDHQFVPAEVPVPAGVKVELIIRNEQAVPAEFESTALHREKVVAPGATASVFVGPLQPGRYEFFDDFNPATRGNLVVR